VGYSQDIECKRENGIVTTFTTVTHESIEVGETVSSKNYAIRHRRPDGMKREGGANSDDTGRSHDVRHIAEAGGATCLQDDLPLHLSRGVAWYQESSGEGWDCQFCKHLTSRWEYAENSRRRFRWRCGFGHAVMEFGQGSERILLAPESCTQWERFVPGQGHGLMRAKA
jgi:hypothetical protein